MKATLALKRVQHPYGRETTHYTTEEGGLWHEWPPDDLTPVFAVKFSDNSIWDPIAGWRGNAAIR